MDWKTAVLEFAEKPKLISVAIVQDNTKKQERIFPWEEVVLIKLQAKVQIAASE